MTPIKNDKGDLIQGDHCNRVGILQSGREAGLNFEYSRGKWELIAKKQGGINGWKISEWKHQG